MLAIWALSPYLLPQACEQRACAPKDLASHPSTSRFTCDAIYYKALKVKIMPTTDFL